MSLIMTDADLKKTPLAEYHERIGGKMVPFAGWYMPVQYTGIIDEHKAVRTTCGIFDISHMGQLFASGKGTTQWLNGMLTNNLNKLNDSQGQYSLMLNDKGGVIDDLILYREKEDEYFIVINASMIDEDVAWLMAHKPEGITLVNASNDFAGFAVQGPESQSVFAKAFPNETLPQRNGIHRFSAQGDSFIVCRTGYTGEDGFEFFCPASSAEKWFEHFINSGAKPCGLGARDSLRLEMCYPLNGSDLSPEKTPLEAGLGFFVDLTKDFTGSEILKNQKEQGLQQRLVALKYKDRGAPPRSHYAVINPENGEKIGELSSGVMSPSLMTGIGMAYLPIAFTPIGTSVEIEVRGKKFSAEVIKKPFYRKN